MLDPIDLTERFGADPDRDEVYDTVTGEMQDALDALDRERGLLDFRSRFLQLGIEPLLHGGVQRRGLLFELR